MLDVTGASIGLVLAAPIILVGMLLVFLSDGRNPMYLPRRVGRHGRPFVLFKLRTMVVEADRSGVDTTVAGDSRLLPSAIFVRALKLDELPQLLNVLLGDMSFVGPRPNVQREVDRYSDEERRLLSVRPGITDIASIVFADLSTALPRGIDPNLGYNQFVRPWKNRLALHYLDNASLLLDLRLIALTVASAVARDWTLHHLSRLLARQGASATLCRVATRVDPLAQAAPPGLSRVVSLEDLTAASAR